MAYPVIIFNSSTGDDSLSSGAGPSTAINSATESSTATTSAEGGGAGTLVTFSGATDLSGVATDGSHCIYLVDSTAGGRNWGRITAVDDGADTVTVDTAFGAGLSGLNWAIGGYRQTLEDSNSKKLYDNNSSAGDMEDGWVVELASGFTETLTLALNIRSGSTTSNCIIIRGESGAATKPVLTITTHIAAFTLYGNQIHIRDIDVDRTGNVDTDGYAVTSGGGDGCICENIKTTGGSLANRWRNCINMGSSSYRTMILNCDLSFSYYELIEVSRGVIVKGCKLRSAGSYFIKSSDYNARVEITDNEMYGCGVNPSYSTSAGVHVTRYGLSMFIIAGNTIVNSGGDGIYLIYGYHLIEIEVYANVIVGSGGYGINASASTYLWIGSGNLVYDSASSPSNNIVNFTAASTADPDFVDAAGGDVTPQTDLAGVAVADKFKPSASFLYPGCIQPEAGTTTNIVVKHPRRGIF